MALETKICSHCKQEKPATTEYFGKQKRSKDGFRKCCKDCKKDYDVLYKQKPEYKEYQRNYNKEYFGKPELKKRKKQYRLNYRLTKEGYLVKLLNSSNRRAKKKNIQFDLDIEWLLNEWSKNNGKCALSNKEFDLTPNGPYLPSIDRIKSGLGYTKDNCRLVVWCVNAALNKWGEEQFFEMCESVVKAINKK